jgi:hypothetical protein
VIVKAVGSSVRGRTSSEEVDCHHSRTHDDRVEHGPAYSKSKRML